MRADSSEVGVQRRLRPWPDTFITSNSTSNQARTSSRKPTGITPALSVDPRPNAGHRVVDGQPELIEGRYAKRALA